MLRLGGLGEVALARHGEERLDLWGPAVFLCFVGLILSGMGWVCRTRFNFVSDESAVFFNLISEPP